jgi:hypothetical protein
MACVIRSAYYPHQIDAIDPSLKSPLGLSQRLPLQERPVGGGGNRVAEERSTFLSSRSCEYPAIIPFGRPLLDSSKLVSFWFCFSALSFLGSFPFLFVPTCSAPRVARPIVFPALQTRSVMDTPSLHVILQVISAMATSASTGLDLTAVFPDSIHKLSKIMQ